MKIKVFILLLSVVFSYASDIAILDAKNSNDELAFRMNKAKKKIYSAVGMGAIPPNYANYAQAVAMAHRAAVVDAYRQLLETLSGVYLEASDVTSNLILKKSEVRTHISAILTKAVVVKRQFSDGFSEVMIEVEVPQ